MKKIYTLALGLIIAAGASAQVDTLLWENFNGESWTEDGASTEEVPIIITEVGNTIVYDLSPGIDGDDKWYNIDLDGYEPNNANQGGEWFRAGAFADGDTIEYDAVFAATSWFAPFNKADNWLVTPSFYCPSNGQLSFFSAPFQTPYYLDGFKVLISRTTNDPLDFKDTVLVAKEFASRSGDTCNYANYTFEPSGAGFVHGQDGMDIEANLSDCSRWRGMLRQHTINLSPFAGSRIYIAFVHDTDDDNLISIDNVLVTGTFVDDASIEESVKFSFSAYPNPATDFITLGYQLNTASEVTVKVIDNTGRTVRMMSLGTQTGNNSVTVDLADLSAGIYSISMESANGKATKKFVKK